jgi:hypothetical protein
VCVCVYTCVCVRACVCCCLLIISFQKVELSWNKKFTKTGKGNFWGRDVIEAGYNKVVAITQGLALLYCVSKRPSFLTRMFRVSSVVKTEKKEKTGRKEPDLGNSLLLALFDESNDTMCTVFTRNPSEVTEYVKKCRGTGTSKAGWVAQKLPTDLADCIEKVSRGLPAAFGWAHSEETLEGAGVTAVGAPVFKTARGKGTEDGTVPLLLNALLKTASKNIDITMSRMREACSGCVLHAQYSKDQTFLENRDCCSAQMGNTPPTLDENYAALSSVTTREHERLVQKFQVPPSLPHLRAHCLHLSHLACAPLSLSLCALGKVGGRE